MHASLMIVPAAGHLFIMKKVNTGGGDIHLDA